jgi:hypothetical protein
MTRIFRIRINRELLRTHLEREDREYVSDARMHRQLIEAGFRQDGEHWIVLERNLGFLQPEEVITAELVSNGAMERFDPTAS